MARNSPPSKRKGARRRTTVAMGGVVPREAFTVMSESTYVIRRPVVRVEANPGIVRDHDYGKIKWGPNLEPLLAALREQRQGVPGATPNPSSTTVVGQEGQSPVC